VRPGTILGSNDAIARLATWDAARADRTPAAAVERLAGDLKAFAAAEGVDHVVVLNVSSTEPPHPHAGELASLAGLDDVLHGGDPDALPSSTLYALAAVSQGFSYVNFTPSLGASLAAVHALAERTGALLAGKDGKTGETLMKTVLAPMFAARNLEVLSWVGHNIFGNRDAIILDDPTNKASKVTTKDQVVTQILGYKPNTLVSIEYVPDMGDWKTAWDHIHFKGFLGCAMTLQFTWQGCDSLLAAPLAIDLARLVDLARQRGAKGLQTHLAPFFKNPEGVAENDFFRQTFALEAYAARLREG
jgi:myo-inositol-1-phosphate synthase